MKLQYHKQRSISIQSVLARDTQPASEADNDAVQDEDATHVDSSSVDVFSHSEVSVTLYVMFYLSVLMAIFQVDLG